MTRHRVHYWVAATDSQRQIRSDIKGKEAKSDSNDATAMSAIVAAAVGLNKSTKLHIDAGASVSSLPVASAVLELLMPIRCHNTVKKKEGRSCTIDKRRSGQLPMTSVKSNKTSSLTRPDATRLAARVRMVPPIQQLHLAIVLFIVHLILIVQGPTTTTTTSTTTTITNTADRNNNNNSINSNFIQHHNSSNNLHLSYKSPTRRSSPSLYGQDDELSSAGTGTSHSIGEARESMALTQQHGVPFYLAAEDELKYKSIDVGNDGDERLHATAGLASGSMQPTWPQGEAKELDSPGAQLALDHQHLRQTTTGEKQTKEGSGGIGGHSVEVDKWNDAGPVSRTSLSTQASGAESEQQQQQQLSIERPVLVRRLNHSSEFITAKKNVSQKLNRLGESSAMSADYDFGFDVSNNNNNNYYNEQQQQQLQPVSPPGQYRTSPGDQEDGFGLQSPSPQSQPPRTINDDHYLSAEDADGGSGYSNKFSAKLQPQKPHRPFSSDSTSPGRRAPDSSSSSLMSPSLQSSSLASALGRDYNVGQATLTTNNMDNEESSPRPAEQRQFNGGQSKQWLESGKNWNTFEPIDAGQTQRTRQAAATTAPTAGNSIDTDLVSSSAAVVAAESTTTTTIDNKKRRSLLDGDRAHSHVRSSISANSRAPLVVGKLTGMATTKTSKTIGWPSVAGGAAHKSHSSGHDSNQETGQMAKYSMLLSAAKLQSRQAKLTDDDGDDNGDESQSGDDYGPALNKNRKKKRLGASSESVASSSASLPPSSDSSRATTSNNAGPISDQSKHSKPSDANRASSDTKLTTHPKAPVHAKARYAPSSVPVVAASGSKLGSAKDKKTANTTGKSASLKAGAGDGDNGGSSELIASSQDPASAAADDNQSSRMFANQFRYVRPAKKLAKNKEKHYNGQLVGKDNQKDSLGQTYETSVAKTGAASGRDGRPSTASSTFNHHQLGVKSSQGISDQLESLASKSDNSGKRSARFVSNARLAENNQTSINRLQSNAVSDLNGAGKGSSDGYAPTGPLYALYDFTQANQTGTSATSEHQATNYTGASGARANSSISIGKPNVAAASNSSHLWNSSSSLLSELKTTKKRDAWNLASGNKFDQDQLSQGSLFRPIVQSPQSPTVRSIEPLASSLSLSSNKFSSKQDLGMVHSTSPSLINHTFKLKPLALDNSNSNNNYSSAQILHLPLGNYINYPQLATLPSGTSTSSSDTGRLAYSLNHILAMAGSNNEGQSQATDASIVRSGFILPELHHRLSHNQYQAPGSWPSSSSSIPVQSLRTLVPAAMALLAQAQAGSGGSGAAAGSADSNSSPSPKQLHALSQLRSLLASHNQFQREQQQQIATSGSGDTNGDPLASSLADHSSVAQQQQQLPASSSPVVSSTAPVVDQMLATSNQLGVSHMGPSHVTNSGGSDGSVYGLMRDYSNSRLAPQQSLPSQSSGSGGGSGGGPAQPSPSGISGGGGDGVGTSSASSADQQGPHMDHGSGGGSHSLVPQAPSAAPSERSEDQRFILSNPYPSEYMSTGGSGGGPHQQESSYSYYESSRGAPLANLSSSSSSAYYYGSAPAASSSHEHHHYPHQQYQNSRSSDAYDMLRPEHKSAASEGPTSDSSGLRGASSLDPFEDLTGPLASSEYERDLSDLDEEFNRHTVFRPARPSAAGSGSGGTQATGHYPSNSMLSYSPERYETVRSNYPARRPAMTSYLAGDMGYGSASVGADYLNVAGSMSSLVPRPYNQHSYSHYHNHHQQQSRAQPMTIANYDSADSIWAEPSWDYSPLASLLGGSSHYATGAAASQPTYRWRPRYTTAHQRISPYATASIGANSLPVVGAASEQPMYSLIPNYASYPSALPTETVSFTMSPLAAAAAAAATALAAADKSRHHHNHAWTFTLPRLASTLAAAQQLSAGGGGSTGSILTTGATSSSAASSSGSSPVAAASQPQAAASPSASLASPSQHAFYYRPATAAAPAGSYILSPVPLYAIAPRPTAGGSAPLVTAASSSIGTPSLVPYAFHPASAANAGGPLIAYRPATTAAGMFTSPLLTTASFAYPFRVPLGGPLSFHQHAPHYYHPSSHHYLQTSASSLRPSSSSSTGSSGGGSASSSRLTSATGSGGLRPFFADLQFAESKSKPNGGGTDSSSSSPSSSNDNGNGGKGLVVKSASNLTQMARNLTRKMFGSASQVRPQFVAPPANYEMSASGTGLSGGSTGGVGQVVHSTPSQAGQNASPTTALGSSSAMGQTAPVTHRSMSVH